MEKIIMKEVNFVANIKKVVAFEEEYGSLFKVFDKSEMKVGKMFKLAEALKADENVDLDRVLKEKGFDGMMAEVMEALSEAGFLPKEVKMEEEVKTAEVEVVEEESVLI